MEQAGRVATKRQRHVDSGSQRSDEDGGGSQDFVITPRHLVARSDQDSCLQALASNKVKAFIEYHNGGIVIDSYPDSCRPLENAIQCPLCPAQFSAKGLASLRAAYLDCVETTGSFREKGELASHFERTHQTTFHPGSNPWGSGGKRFYWDSSDDDEFIDPV